MTSRRIAHLAAAIALVGLLWFALETAAVADMTVTQEVTTTVGDQKTTQTQTLCWTKNKAKSGMPDGGMVVTDLDKKTFTIINAKEKMYIVQTFDDMKQREALIPAEMRDMKLSVNETGEKKTIDEYPCEKLILKTGPAEITVWVTKKIGIDPAVVEFNKTFLELTKDIKMLNVEAQMRAEFEKRNAYPYLTIVEIPLPLAGKTQRVEAKVKKVSYDKIDASVFAVPEGYKPMELPTGMPGQE